MPQARLVSTVGEEVSKMQKTTVFVLGDLILDTYISGKVSRISPEAPVPVVVEDKTWAVLGGAANVAANITAFGGSVVLSGRIGQDTDGDQFLALCSEHSIDPSMVVRSQNIPTTRKLRVMAGYQQLVRVDAEVTTELSSKDKEFILDCFEKFAKVKGPKAFVISDYGKGVCTTELLGAMIKSANSKEIPVITDPKSLDLKRYFGSDIIKPNLSEGRALLKMTAPGTVFSDFDREVAAICDAVLAGGASKNIVLSLSEKGVLVAGSGVPKPERHSSAAVQVADVSGAGDTMISFLAMGVAAGLGLSRSVHLANMGSGIVCTKLGTATVTAREFMSLLNQKSGLNVGTKILPPDELSSQLDRARIAGETIVFTNGCFDLLHAGHIEILEKSKSFGDRLVVALNSDASVARLKGPTRPLQNQQDRARIMAAMSCVDFVTIFDDETPLTLIKQFKPDVLVKGGDWSDETIVGAKEVKAWGGRVEVVPLVEGRSTTSLVDKSKKK